MKVLAAIVASPHRKVTGATNAGRELSVALADLIDIELAIMWDRDEETQIGNLKVHHLQSMTPFGSFKRYLPNAITMPFLGSKLPDLILQGDYDLVHLHNLFPELAAMRIMRACHRRGIPCVVSSHGFYEQNQYAKLMRFGKLKSAAAEVLFTKPFRHLVKTADAIFTLSDREGDLLTSLGVEKSRVHLVTNGVTEYFLEAPSSEEIEAARAKFHIGDKPVLLDVGSLHRYKGVDIFLRSLRSIEHPFQAVLVGDFRSENERAQYLEEAGPVAAEPNKIVLTGRVTDAELRALYHLGSIFVYPTQGDTLPLVVLEAMASGLPIVSTTIAGLPFMVGPDEGLLVPPGDAGAIASAANHLLSNPSLRQQLGESARKRVEENFRWRRAAKQAEAAYEAVLGRSQMVARSEH